MGMLGVAAVTGLSYAITSSLSSGDSDDAESKVALNNFERFGAEHFLTDFGSKRSFDNLTNANVKTGKTKRRRRRSNINSRMKPSTFYQPISKNYLSRTPRIP